MWIEKKWIKRDINICESKKNYRGKKKLNELKFLYIHSGNEAALK